MDAPPRVVLCISSEVAGHDLYVGSIAMQANWSRASPLNYAGCRAVTFTRCRVMCRAVMNSDTGGTELYRRNTVSCIFHVVGGRGCPQATGWSKRGKDVEVRFNQRVNVTLL